MHAALIFAVLLVSALAQDAKRSLQATSCDATGMLDIELCPSASEGAFCLAPTESMPATALSSCGCKQDADCFTSAAYPLCERNTVGGGVCTNCFDKLPNGLQTAAAIKATNVDDHQFCRFRFPSKYRYTLPPELAASGNTLPAAENVASATTLTGYFREVCNRNGNGNGGACEGCQQASPDNTPDITFPTYPVGFTTLALWGSIHCRHVYNTAPKIRPICAFRIGFFDTVFSPSVWTTLTGQNEIGDGAYPTVGVNTETRTVNLWQGACFPCIFESVGRHGLCARSDPTNPICQANGGCGACKTNVECQVQSNCLTTGTCTGTYGTTVGQNCMKNGECKSCATDADCGTLDGGEKIDQQTCTNGVCGDVPDCTSNADCPAGTNCMKDGKCVACTVGTQCRNNDGPPGTNAAGNAGQPYCVAGVCQDCSLNSHCVNTGGANCEKNGRCENCGTQLLNSPVCGNADGGAASPVTQADDNNQEICNTNTQICETKCNNNQFCATKGGSDTFTRGANCQADGTCKDCTTTPNTCGQADGGESPNQSTCNTQLKLCYNPFSCSTNSDCDSAQNTGGGKNCQLTQECISCAVSYTSTTCSNFDGGETPNQPNCNLNSRRCVPACNNNGDCAGTQGANCMANGVCFDCRTDADCATGNAWNGDKGGDTICSGTICTPACANNGACQSNENCMKNGRCVACTSDTDCKNNDGPPPMGTNTKCSNGRCVDPYQCQKNARDNADCLANTGQANCQADTSCNTCRSNADCGVLDGGLVPGQPRCDTSTGICGPCQVNADCPSSIPNCGADGSCYDCRTINNNQCGTRDGGEVPNQRNCDSRDGICVNFCTSDANCAALDCTPFCNIDKGCCVECTSDNQCPYSRWTGAEALKVNCQNDWCVPSQDCYSNDDCPDNSPVCLPVLNICVECMYDVHCGGDTPACSPSQSKCVECITSEHCQDRSNGEDDEWTCGFDQLCTNGGSVLTAVSTFVAVFAAFVLH